MNEEVLALLGREALTDEQSLGELAPGQRRAGAGDEGEVIFVLGAIGLAEEEPGPRRQGP
ncbi:MAG: hypothetical protein INF97_18435 [Roseomonas sp.]|nr:hypothetical protein [Roseomonas sp.]